MDNICSPVPISTLTFYNPILSKIVNIKKVPGRKEVEMEMLTVFKSWLCSFSLLFNYTNRDRRRKFKVKPTHCWGRKQVRSGAPTSRMFIRSPHTYPRVLVALIAMSVEASALGSPVPGDLGVLQSMSLSGVLLGVPGKMLHFNRPWFSQLS